MLPALPPLSLFSRLIFFFSPVTVTIVFYRPSACALADGHEFVDVGLCRLLRLPV